MSSVKLHFRCFLSKLDRRQTSSFAYYRRNTIVELKRNLSCFILDVACLVHVISFAIRPMCIKQSGKYCDSKTMALSTCFLTTIKCLLFSDQPAIDHLAVMEGRAMSCDDIEPAVGENRKSTKTTFTIHHPPLLGFFSFLLPSFQRPYLWHHLTF